MKKEDQEYFDAMFDLFGSDGWKAFVQQINKGAAAVANELAFKADVVSSDLHFMRGKIQAFASVTGFQNALENQYEQLKAEERREAEDADI